MELKNWNEEIRMNRDLILEMIGQLMLVEKIDGRKFVARLIGIDGDELYFENKQKLISMVKRAAICELTVVG